MTRWSALLAALVAIASTAVWAPTATAAACSGSTGVTVVVDFGSLGGGAQVACVPGDPTSGLRALAGAGYGYTFASRQPGLVCRINGKPAEDPCVNAPPTTAYWSYWHATRGGVWVYSTAGAGSRDPAPGTVEGWAFGAGRPPAVAPPAPAAAPKPTTTAAPPRTTTTTRVPASPKTTTTAPRPTTTTSKPGTTTTATGTSTTAATTTTTPSTSEAAAVTAEVEPRAGEQEGNAASFLIGAAVVVLLGGLAIGAARRRAKADPL